jgi:hypothetical protein
MRILWVPGSRPVKLALADDCSGAEIFFAFGLRGRHAVTCERIWTESPAIRLQKGRQTPLFSVSTGEQPVTGEFLNSLILCNLRKHRTLEVSDLYRDSNPSLSATLPFKGPLFVTGV